MALPPHAYMQLQLEAPYHVQVKLDRKVTEGPNSGQVAGRVVTVFRGSDKLSCGDEIRFPVELCRHDDDIIFGAGGWIHIDDLNAAQYMEVFLDGEPPYCIIADYCPMIIGAPTTVPRAHVYTKEEVASAVEHFESYKERPTRKDWKWTRLAAALCFFIALFCVLLAFMRILSSQDVPLFLLTLIGVINLSVFCWICGRLHGAEEVMTGGS